MKHEGAVVGKIMVHISLSPRTVDTGTAVSIRFRYDPTDQAD